MTLNEIETEMGRDLDSGAPGVRTRSALAEKDDKEKVWVDALDSGTVIYQLKMNMHIKFS